MIRQIAIVSILLAYGGSIVHAADRKIEKTPAEIKSIYTMYIAEYTKWPDAADEKKPAQRDADKPFVIGIVGNDPNNIAEPFKQKIASISGMAINERNVELIDLPELGTRQMETQVIEALENCNLLFFSEDSEAEWYELRALLRNRPIMTVSELDGFASQGGIVEYEYDEAAQRMYMIFNMQAIKDSGLVVSDTLLNLKVVKTLLKTNKSRQDTLLIDAARESQP